MAVTPILDIGKSAANVPFEVHTMEWIATNRWQQNEVPHRHSYFVIIWVKKGEGTHLIDLAEAKKIYKKADGFGSLYGSSKIADNFNVKYGVYKQAQNVDSYIDPSLTEAAK